MKIKIVSDGTYPGTRIVNTETGEILEWVTKVTWTCDEPDEMAKATLTMINVPVEVEGETDDGS